MQTWASSERPSKPNWSACPRRALPYTLVDTVSDPLVPRRVLDELGIRAQRTRIPVADGPYRADIGYALVRAANGSSRSP